MAFVKFESLKYGRGPRMNIGYVSMRPGKTQQFYINVAGVRLLGLPSGRNCDLYYDEDRHCMAIEVLEGILGGARLRPNNKNAGVFVSVGAFLKTFNLTVLKCVRYPITKDQKTGFLIVQFDDQVKRGDN